MLVTMEQRYTLPLNIVLANASLASICSQLPYRMQPRVTQVYNLLTQGAPNHAQVSACPLNRSKRFRAQFKALAIQQMEEVKFMKLTEQIHFAFQAHHICLECGDNRTRENNSVHSVRRTLATLNELPPNSIWRTRSACLTLNMPTLVRIEQGPLTSCTPEAISGLLSSLAIDSQVASASSPAAADSSIRATAPPLSPLSPLCPLSPLSPSAMPSAPSHLPHTIFATHSCQICENEASPHDKSLRHLSLAKQGGKNTYSLPETIDPPTRIPQLDNRFAYQPPSTFYPAEDLEETAHLLQHVLSHGITLVKIIYF